MNDFGVDEKKFWITVEKVIGESIPIYLKIIITAAGYARYSCLKNINEDVKVELEGFAREQMTMFPKSSENFHIFSHDPREFRIVPGHWRLLCEMSRKLPESKKLFLKLQHKVNEPSLQAEINSVPLKKPERNANGSEHSKKVAPDESTLLIQAKVKAWLEAKGIEIPGEIAVNILGSRRASIKCFCCSKSVSLSTRDNKSGSWGWIVSNFTQHVLQHTSPKGNTLDNYFQRHAMNTGTQEQDSESTTQSAPSHQASIEAPAFSIQPVENSLENELQGTAELVSNFQGSQEYECVIYEEVIDNHGVVQSDSSNYFPSHSSQKSQMEDFVQYDDGNALDIQQENKEAVKMVLGVEYV